MPGRRLFVLAKGSFGAPPEPRSAGGYRLKRKGPPERPMVLEVLRPFLHSRCQLAADRLAAAAGLMLALHWPFGP